MSLLKLLFDLPEAGGESNFTVEEQEELMAFEHNLDEHMVEDFALPASDDQFGFLQGQDGGSRDPAEGHVDLPVTNGALANGVDVEKELVPLMKIVPSLENGNIFGSSAIENSTEVTPVIQEPGSVENTAVSQKTAETAIVSLPESTPAAEPAAVPLPEITPATASLQPAVASFQAVASIKKCDISSKHQGSGKAVWVKV